MLPRWRGAAPIQAAILAGDPQTGVTIMRMDPGVDTGPTLSQRATPIQPQDTAAALGERLSTLGAELLLETLPGYLSGEIAPRPQDEAHATYAPMLQKDAGALDFNQPAESLARKVRAYNPWPGAALIWQGQAIKVHQAHTVSLPETGVPGATILYQKQPAVFTPSGLLVLDEVQPAGKRPMPGKSFLGGARLWGQISVTIINP